MMMMMMITASLGKRSSVILLFAGVMFDGYPFMASIEFAPTWHLKFMLSLTHSPKTVPQIAAMIVLVFARSLALRSSFGIVGRFVSFARLSKVRNVETTIPKASFVRVSARSRSVLRT